MDKSEARAGQNEAVFRTVNQRLEELNQAFATFSDRFSIVCECGDSACVERISIKPEEYEALRADPTQFAMIPGHEAATVEEVVEERPEYVVVRKRPGEPAELAERTDPRADR